MPVLAAVADASRDTTVVTVGRDIADAYGERLVVLHVMPETEFQDRREENLTYYQDEGVHDAKVTARRVAEAALECEDVNTVPDVSVEGAIGDPAEKLLDGAAERDARYLVVGGRRRSPVGKALFGSVTQSVLLDADRPVVTVRTGQSNEGG
jgi:nucleotide-binding universal stress UspA family protein